MIDGGDRDDDEDIPPARPTTVSKVEHGSSDDNFVTGSRSRTEQKEAPRDSGRRGHEDGDD